MRSLEYDPLVLALALVVSIAPDGVPVLARVALGLAISLAFGVTWNHPKRASGAVRISRKR